MLEPLLHVHVVIRYLHWPHTEVYNIGITYNLAAYFTSFKVFFLALKWPGKCEKLTKDSAGLCIHFSKTRIASETRQMYLKHQVLPYQMN